MDIRQRQISDALKHIDKLHPVIKRIYSSRGISSLDDCLLNLSSLHRPEEMNNMELACDLLEAALYKQNSILIVGDFDADGATSSALAMLSMKAMGFAHVDFLVPNRFEFGYGLTPEIVQVALQRKPDLIITVDNGIASMEGVALAKSNGVKVLVTDHHLPGSELPEADCLLNPNLSDCTFPSKSLAGVGVVFYLMLALRSRLRDVGWFASEGIVEPNLGDYLDIVALGTVADVVPLDKNNRCLVKNGLQKIVSGRGRPGIRALLEVAGRDLSSLSASDLGFAVGPRLNAAGRLDDMSLGIECLLCDDENKAKQLAYQLDEMNKDRRNIEQNMQANALEALELLSINDEGRAGLCLYDASWHQGVIGILASRLKEKFHKPTIIFADAGDGTIKGSARSISGLHMRDLLDLISKQKPKVLQKFGGHAMAAGLSLRLDDFEEFCGLYYSTLEELVDEETLTRVHYTDGVLESEYLSLEFAQLLRESGPWGQHFPEPVFEGQFRVQQQKIVGSKHLKLVLELPASNMSIDAIAFNQAEEVLQKQHQEIRVLYRLDVNSFRGRQTPQLMIENLL